MNLYMKTSVIVLLTFFSVSITAQFPAGFCGLTQDEMVELSQRIADNRKFADETGFIRGNDVKYVPVRFTIVRPANGTGGVSEKNILRLMCRLNEDYAPQNIRFYFKDDFKYMNNDLVNTDPRSSGGSNIMRNNKDALAMNIYLVADIKTDGAGIVYGYYHTQHDYLVIRNNQVNYDSETTAHEIGHFFSLNHTFFGWECEAYDRNTHGDTVRIVNSPCIPSIQVELVNKSNCDSAADGMCDTPPDYNFGFGWPNSCPEFTTRVYDRNGERINPSQNNFMSYFFGCNDYHFTPNQMTAIAADLASFRRNYLKNTYAPPALEVSADVNYLFPINMEEVDRTQPIVLDWAPVDGATHYILEYAPSPSFTQTTTKRFVVNTDSYEIPANDLTANANFYWRILPYNPTVTCNSSASPAVFKATNMLAINSLDEVANWTVTPNPAVSGSELNLFINAPVSLDIDVDFQTISGVAVSSIRNKKINSGDNEFSIPMTNVPSGIYLVTIKSKLGTGVRKVIVR